MIPKYLIDAAEDIDKAQRATGTERYLAVASALASCCDALNHLVSDLRREGSNAASAIAKLRNLQKQKRNEYRDGFNDLLYRLADFERRALSAAGVPPRVIDNIIEDSQALTLNPDAELPSPSWLADQIEKSDLLRGVCGS
jgi:hypothetical protein